MHGTRDASDDDRSPVVDEQLRAVIDAAAGAAVVVVIGESDTGKTTLVTALANAAFARGFGVGIVDADLGQSEIGPPTTIGLGRVRGPLARMGDAEQIALERERVSFAKEALTLAQERYRLAD